MKHRWSGFRLFLWAMILLTIAGLALLVWGAITHHAIPRPGIGLLAHLDL